MSSANIYTTIDFILEMEIGFVGSRIQQHEGIIDGMIHNGRESRMSQIKIEV